MTCLQYRERLAERTHGCISPRSSYASMGKLPGLVLDMEENRQWSVVMIGVEIYEEKDQGPMVLRLLTVRLSQLVSSAEFWP